MQKQPRLLFDFEIYYFQLQKIFMTCVCTCLFVKPRSPAHSLPLESRLTNMSHENGGTHGRCNAITLETFVYICEYTRRETIDTADEKSSYSFHKDLFLDTLITSLQRTVDKSVFGIKLIFISYTRSTAKLV